MMSQEEIEEFLYKYKSTNMIFVNDKDKMKYNRILLENIDLKNRLDKIKEYCNHKLEMLELQKRNIMQILTPENGYLKTDIEIEMQKYKDILELLEEIE
jgi:hypothetical protein